MENICVVITTYERPYDCLELVRDIRKKGSDRNVTISVYDDNSSSDYSQVKKECDHYHKNDKNNGKKEHWKTVDRIFKDLKGSDFDYYYFLPDDIELREGIFDRTIDLWEHINDPFKITLSLHLHRKRLNRPNWTGLKPVINILDNGEPVYVTGWVDMCFMFTHKFLESVEFECPEVPKSRWKRNSNLSSGVGEMLSRSLFDRRNMYGVFNSEIINKDAAYRSNMNESERKKNPPDQVYNNKLDPVIFSVASIPSRSDSLRKMVRSIYHQADRINVFLNNYESIPDWLVDDKIHVEIGDNSLGDAGKFYWAEDVKGYHFTCDDDIIYPETYWIDIINKIEEHGRSVVGLHGVVIGEIVESYYKNRKVYHCRHGLKNDTHVNLLGTGALAYHTSSIPITIDHFLKPNMADVFFALQAQKNKVPMVCIERDSGYLNALKFEDNIYVNEVDNDKPQTDYINSIDNWKVNYYKSCSVSPYYSGKRIPVVTDGWYDVDEQKEKMYHEAKKGLDPEKKNYALSILIPTMTSRRKMFNELWDELIRQLKENDLLDDVEVVHMTDRGRMPIGYKRNELAMKSRGKFLVYLDDDDKISKDYAYHLAKQAKKGGVDAITFNGKVTIDGNKPRKMEFNKDHIKHSADENIVRKPPGHLNALRREIVLRHPFVVKGKKGDKNREERNDHGSDVTFSKELVESGEIKEARHINKTLYYYRYISKKGIK